jgi:hypothetical protein
MMRNEQIGKSRCGKIFVLKIQRKDEVARRNYHNSVRSKHTLAHRHTCPVRRKDVLTRHGSQWHILDRKQHAYIHTKGH